jgi:hypothetical protein
VANATCVKLKCEVKEIFDKNLKKDILEEMEKTIQPLIDGTKGLKFDPKCKDGWELTATASVTADKADNPTTIDVNVAINGLHLQGSLKAIKATGGAKADGFSARKVKEYAKQTVHDALEDLMNKRVLKALLP